jgi:hypothetical protein
MTEPRLATSDAEPVDDTPSGSWRLRLDDAASDADEPAPISEGTGVWITLFVLSLVWLAGTMGSAHLSIARDAAQPTAALGTAAIALPSVILATMLAAMAAGLLGAARFAAAGTGWTRRVAAALCGGLAIGLATGAVIVWGYGHGPAMTVLAVAAASAGLVGGAVTLVRPLAAIGGGIAAMLGIFALGAAVGLVRHPLKSLLGAGETVSSQVAAAERLFFLSALISGCAAGLIAFAFLRRRGHRWPWFALAGALPGLILLAGEVVTRLGGMPLLTTVGKLSIFDQFSVDESASDRLSNALIVGFAGAIVAIVAVGRTMRPAEEPVAERLEPETVGTDD